MSAPIAHRPTALLLACTLALLAPGVAFAKDPPHTEGTDEPAIPSEAEPAADTPQVRIQVISRVGDNDEAIREEVLATATEAFASEGFAVVDEADTLVQIVVTRPSEGSPDYEVQLGYSLSVDDAVHRDSSVMCPRCSATDLLDSVETASRGLATKLLAPPSDEAPPAETNAEPDAGADTMEDSTPERRPKGDPISMLGSGVFFSVVGGAGLVGSIVAIGMESGRPEGVAPIGWAALGVSGALTAIGVPLLIVGTKRMRAEHPRVGFAPGRRAAMVTVSGRF